MTAELSPSQLHNLADITERKVIGAPSLFADIFAQHAVSRAGKLQVELAQLRYTQPRLVGKSRAMDRLMGGIGGRGPGETKLETDRRKIRDRMARIRRNLTSCAASARATRARRSRQGIPLAALVGYTNAGKSTLLNTLTRSEVLAENKLFATLDPPRGGSQPLKKNLSWLTPLGLSTICPRNSWTPFAPPLKNWRRPNFAAACGRHSHSDLLQQINAVETILAEMELDRVPRLLILNKWDQLEALPGRNWPTPFPLLCPSPPEQAGAARCC